ncbi:hypothetical protein A8B78_02020 [Jannaschia sp. EhC01]|nr:hypothetical protein A8B78_02020 [Jannaschia sp. EhC01]
MTIVRLEAWVTQTAYKSAVTFTVGGAAAAVHHLWLRVTDDTGTSGLSETIVKPEWTGLDAATTMAAVEHLLWPRMGGLDAPHARAAVQSLRGLPMLHASVGHAVRDMEAPQPSRVVDVATVLTRDTPDVMADAAKAAQDTHGITAIKMKAGQGLAIDAACVSSIRKTLGDGAAISLDANSAYGVEDGLELCRIAADHGVDFVEDPWPLAPDQATQDAIARAPLPICVDRPLNDAALGQAMLDRGAMILAAKPNRIGPDAAKTIEDAAHAMGARSVAAMFGEGCLGALQQVRGVRGNVAFEAAHWLDLDAPVAVPGMTITNGQLHAPTGRAADLVDKAELQAKSIQSWEAHHA